MSRRNTGGLLSTYNSLTDKHLANYFSNTRIRRHLQRAGLITRSGRIVPDKEYKHKLIQRAHQRHIRDCLAQAFFHKVMEMERIHQIEIKRNLEEFVRRERVHRMKVERSKKYKEDMIPVLSPHPPMRARDIQKQHSGPEEEHSESSGSPSSSRPNTAPGKMQRPVRLKPIHSNSTTASLRRGSPYRPHKSPHEDEQLFHSTMDKKPRRHLTTMEAIHGISPHCLPVINNFVTPVPPVTKKKQNGVKVPPSSSTVRGRRLRPYTSSNGADDPPWLRSSVHQTKVRLNMVYFGKTVHLTNDLLDLRDEVKVFQQHCGGENLCVYKGKLLEGEMFQFISRRHRGFPFSLTFYLNGLQVERLSSCCEFKHSKGSRLGGRHGHFGFSSVEDATPCYKCIIAMGLAKKPTPPPKIEKEDNTQEQSANSTLDGPEMETERTEDDTTSHFEPKTSQQRGPDTQIQEQTASGRDKVRDDYEEDFEADDEGPVEEITVEEEKSPSPVRETETLVQEENISETDDDGNDEDTVSRSGSSISSSNQEESDAETVKDSTKDEEADPPKEDDFEEMAAPTDQNEEPKSDETAKVEATSDSAGDSTEIEISDTSTTPGSVTKQGDDASEDKNNEETVHENKTEDELDRAKSVQEKLAEAILKESQCSTEPELSDTSTEEEEGPTAKDPKQENNDQEQTVLEETKREEIVTDEVAQKQEESPEAKEEEGEEKQPPDKSESIKDEVSEAEEDGKFAEDEVTAEGDKSEESNETQLHADDENVAQDDRTEDPFDGSKSAGASENNEEREGKVVVEADVHTDETGQKAESRKEDESSVLETDETAVTEATAASETMEIKAESSEEREALGFEEAPETDAERRQQADSEDDTAASQTEVTAENSSCSPEEAAGSTGEKTANECEETTKDESNEGEIKEEAQEQTSETDEQKNDDEQEKCEPEEEKMEVNEKVHENTKKQESEEEEQTQMNSEEITDENTQETEQKQTEEITDDSKVENCADTNENITESQSIENEEAAKHLEAVNTENIEEEKTENVEDSECVKNQSEGGDDSQNKNLTETNTASEENNDGAGKSEKAENEEKVTESEAEEKDVREGEEVSEMTEKQEESDDEEKNKICAENTAESEDVCDSEAAETQKVQNITENESDVGETAGASENGAIDAENGEISFADESNPNEDEEEAPAKENTDSETTEQAKEKPEELGEESTEGKDVDPEEAAEKLEYNISGVAPDTDLTQSSTKEGDDSEAKHHETKDNPELDMSEPGIKESEEKKDDEETGGIEKGKKSDPEHKNKTLENIENISEFVLSEDQETSSLPTNNDGDAVNHLEEDKDDSVSDKNPENVADGETGGATEEASKASEEGASVLLKPSAQNNVAEQNVTVREETPETLTNKNNTDMVTNWIMMHQSSKYFETFVEPLEDLREEVLDIKASNSDDNETPSTELPKSEGPLNMAKMFGNEGESKATTETETEDLDNIQDDQYDPVKTALQGEENHVASNEESHQNGHKGDVEKDQAQAGPAKETHEKAEAGSFSGSLKSERVFGTQSDEKVTSVGSDPQAAADLPLTTEGFHESESPDALNNAGQTEDQTGQITTLYTSKPADGSHEESGGEDVHPETLGDRFNGETGDVELIKQFSNDHLSSFSVDRALFAHTSYPLPLTSGAESGP